MNECQACGRKYLPTSDARRSHRMLMGHTPSPAPEKATADPFALDRTVRADEAAERDARRTGGAG